MSKHLEPGVLKRQELLPAKGAPMGSLIPVTEWNKFHPWPPLGGLRHLIFFAETNGFDQVIRRIGRRVLIDENAFFQWANNKGASNEAH